MRSKGPPNSIASGGCSRDLVEAGQCGRSKRCLAGRQHDRVGSTCPCRPHVKHAECNSV